MTRERLTSVTQIRGMYLIDQNREFSYDTSSMTIKRLQYLLLWSRVIPEEKD